MDFSYNAPLLVLVFSNRDGRTPVRDCSLAAGNMMLAASSLGLGSYLIGTGLSIDGPCSTGGDRCAGRS